MGLAFTLPFEFVPTIEAYGLRLRLSLPLGLALMAIAAARLATGRQRFGQLGLPQWLLAAYGLWLLISAVPPLSFDKAVGVVVPMGFMIGVALAASVLWERRYLAGSLRAALWGAAAATVFGFYQFFGNWAGLPQWATALREEYSWERFGFPRIQATALEPLYFSAFLLLPIGLLSALIINSPRYRRWPYYVLLLGMLLADVLTLSRGGLVALVVMQLLIAGLSWRQLRLRRNFKKVAVVVLGAVAVLAMAAMIINVIGRQGNRTDLTYGKQGAATFVSRLTDLNPDASQANHRNNDSTSVRERGREQAIDILSSAPDVLWFGVGAGQYETYAERRLGPQNAVLPNNLVLEQLLQYGIVGFGLLMATGLLVLIGLLRRVGQNDLPGLVAKALAAYLVALFLQAQTFSGIALTHLWFAIGLGLFLVQWHPDKRKRHAQKADPQKEA